MILKDQHLGVWIKFFSANRSGNKLGDTSYIYFSLVSDGCRKMWKHCTAC